MRRVVDQIGLRIVQKLRPPAHPVSRREIRFTSSAGYRIEATLVAPTSLNEVPAIVVCPGSDQDRSVFFNGEAPVQAEELAAMGVAVLSHDPSGRGSSWGPEDWGGLEHQDNVVQAVQWLRSEAPLQISQVGIVGISLGIASAIGAARQLAVAETPVSWVIDWEGPCDQRTITANQTMNAPAMGHRRDDAVYWSPREAVRHVGAIQAGYWRLQAETDHAQPGELQHAVDMLTAASSGQLPWFQINDHSPATVPQPIRWLRSGKLSANRALRRAVSTAISRA